VSRRSGEDEQRGLLAERLVQQVLVRAGRSRRYGEAPSRGVPCVGGDDAAVVAAEPDEHDAVIGVPLPADIVRNLVTFVVMLVVAFLVGFRFEGSLAGALAATGLMFLFSYAFSWIQALIGLSVGSVEAANSAGFIWMFPLTFVSSAFVDPANMTSWLQPIAEHNPFSVLTDACRALYNGYDPGNDPWIALAWAIGITIVFAILTTRKFARSTSA
jgi:ABC-type polysaccharide/polyol phosphate export permease